MLPDADADATHAQAGSCSRDDRLASTHRRRA
jgi:hypothetical protein